MTEKPNLPTDAAKAFVEKCKATIEPLRLEAINLPKLTCPKGDPLPAAYFLFAVGCVAEMDEKGIGEAVDVCDGSIRMDQRIALIINLARQMPSFAQEKIIKGLQAEANPLNDLESMLKGMLTGLPPQRKPRFGLN